MLRRSPLLGLLIPIALLAETPVAQRKPADRLAPFLQQHCSECHTGPEAEGDFSLDRQTFDVQPYNPDWRRVRTMLASGKMPPKTEPRPPQGELQAALAALDGLIAEHVQTGDPGRVTLRRLNRVEYENSVRDLVGVEIDATSFFPPDEVGYGFDNVADVLSMPDVLLEKYVAAAEHIAARAIVVPDPEHAPTHRVRDDEIVHTEKFSTHGGAWSLYTNGFVGVDFEFPMRGEYLLRARAWGTQAGKDLPRMLFRIARAELGHFDVAETSGDPGTYELKCEVEAGKQRFAVEFINDFWNPDEPDKRKRDRNLYVEWLEIAGPVGVFTPSAFQQRLMGAEGRRDVRQLVEELAERAWRRPVTRTEVDRLMSLAERGDSREEILRTTLVAILSSPCFLFRVENDPSGAKAGAARDLDGYELATRLSYFLWSTMPDDGLFAAAASGALADDDALEGQVRRMLRDARASELVRNFAGQWLQLRTLDRVQPDPVRFSNFDDELREAMRAEAEMLFEAVLREDRPVAELIDPDFTFVNQRLAEHYGLEGVEGRTMRRIRLDESWRDVRGGLLQMASMHVVTSNPTRTSPVKRGKWVLETLLGSPPLAPQPGVDSLDESPEAVKAASLRERLAQHRADPKCAVCHDRMDNLGFALESFDPTGRWRSEADGFAVDASGELEDGTPFVGPALLEERLAQDPAFVRCLIEKLAIYAVGRGMRPADEPALDALAARFAQRSPTLAELVAGIVELDLFRRTVVANAP